MARMHHSIGKSITLLVLTGLISVMPAMAIDDSARSEIAPDDRPVQMATLFAPKKMPAPSVKPRPRKVIQIQQGVPMLAPFAHVRFCVHHPEECEASVPAVDRFVDAQVDALDVAKQTNDLVNAAIRSQPDAAKVNGDVWTLAPSAGDCDDFAVTKRSLLIKAGWPSSNVLLAHVVTRQGEDHLVTIVRTNDGDFVLDNLDRTLRAIHETRYRWVSIQSSENPRFWHRAEMQARPFLVARL